MGQPRFPFPGTIAETIELLNSSAVDWGLSQVREGETLYIYSGDQTVFVAETDQEALDFLSGAFLATFYGKGLDQIRSELADRNRQSTE